MCGAAALMCEPRLARCRIMTREDATEIAVEYVKRNYRVAPPVAFTIDAEGLSLPGEYCDSFLVFFRCSWDTDEMGLPERLAISVDRASGTARHLPDDW
jgi:hypothetical protein